MSGSSRDMGWPSFCSVSGWACCPPLLLSLVIQTTSNLHGGQWQTSQPPRRFSSSRNNRTQKEKRQALLPSIHVYLAHFNFVFVQAPVGIPQQVALLSNDEPGFRYNFCLVTLVQKACLATDRAGSRQTQSRHNLSTPRRAKPAHTTRRPNTVSAQGAWRTRVDRCRKAAANWRRSARRWVPLAASGARDSCFAGCNGGTRR